MRPFRFTKYICFVGYRKKNWSNRESPGIASLAARSGVSSPLYNPLPVMVVTVTARASLRKGECPHNSWFLIRNESESGDSLLLRIGEFMRTSICLKPTIYFFIYCEIVYYANVIFIVFKLLYLSSCIWNILKKDQHLSHMF